MFCASVTVDKKSNSCEFIPQTVLSMCTIWFKSVKAHSCIRSVLFLHYLLIIIIIIITCILLRLLLLWLLSYYLYFYYYSYFYCAIAYLFSFFLSFICNFYSVVLPLEPSFPGGIGNILSDLIWSIIVETSSNTEVFSLNRTVFFLCSRKESVELTQR